MCSSDLDLTPDLGSDQYIAKTIIEELYKIDSLKDYLNSKQGEEHLKEIENWIDSTFSDEKPFTDSTPGGELVDSDGNIIPSEEEQETDENIREAMEESKKMLEEQKRQEQQKRQGKIDFEEAMDDLLDQLSQAIKNKNVNQQNYIKKLIDDLNASNDKLFGLDLSEEESGSYIKPGVPELFESYPELAQIGTAEQYSQWLDSGVFPDRQVKDILYHGTDKEFDDFKLGKEEVIHFGTELAAAQRIDVDGVDKIGRAHV